MTRHRTLRAVTLIAALALTAVACGDNENTDAGDTNATTTETTVANTEAETTPAPLTTTPATESSTEPTDAPATRTIEHALGSVDVPDTPQRIVALDENVGFLLLDLGAVPATILGSFFSATAPPIADSYDVEIIPFDIGNPSLEALAALEPDLLIGTEHPSIVERYDDYTAIAPTVIVPFTADWREQVELVAATIDADTEGQARIDALDADIERVRDRIASELPTAPSISVIGSLSDMLFAIPAHGIPAGDLLVELGLPRPAAQDVDVTPDNPFVFFSNENLTSHDADHVFVLSGGIFQPDPIGMSPLFANLTGTTVDVDGEAWTFSHAFAVSWMVNDLEAILLDGEPAATTTDSLQRWEDFTS